jgi:DHA1 family bicyclomycin/chloramphenicol resistance-like MFS transporter
MKERQGRGEFVALMAAASATIAIAIDAMLPAFADVRDHFGLAATSSDAALIITVFMAGLGIGHFVYGPLADRFGRKPVFIAGLLLYIVAGFATAFASTLNTLLLGWFFWGLGAAGPRVVSQAMLRDRYRGDLLARAMAIILTIFLIVPTLAPVLGQALLHLGSWRYTFAVGPAFGTVVTLWSTRVTESLEESMRLPLDLRSIGRAAAEVLRTPTALGNTVALMMLTAAFLPYLASSERMYGEVYERGSQFFLWFALTSVVMAGFTLATTTIVTRLGTRRTAMGALAPLVAVAAINLVVTHAAAGAPNFAFFFSATTLLVSLNTALTPLLTSRALDDVGHMAGNRGFNHWGGQHHRNVPALATR